MKITNTLTEHRFDIYEYVCDALSITCNSKTYPIENIQILGLYLERNYDEDHLPVFMMQLVMADDLYYNICNNHKSTTFTMKLKSQISVSETEKTAGSLYINGTFEPVGEEGSPYHSQQLYDAIKEKSTAGEGSMLTDFANVRTFILCSRQQLNATKTVSNYVLSSATMTDAASVVLSQANAVKPLVSPFDNTSTYSELILLPQPAIPQLKYLNNFFGFYKEGAQIFFDLNYTYILRNTAKCTAYVPNEIQTVVFCVYDTVYGETAKIGSTTDLLNKVAYIGLSSMNFRMDNLSNSANEYLGSNATIINNDGTITKASPGTGESVNILSVRNHNKFFSDEMALRIKELSCVVYLNLQSVDLNLLTPNKTFRIMSTDTNITKKVSGLFRLVSTQTTFIKNGDHYLTNTLVQLRRTDA